MGKRHFSLEFRREALELLKSSGRPPEEVAGELGISVGTLYRWQKNPPPPPRGVGAKAQALSAQEENRQLRRELQRVRMERDILKKAVAFFVKEST